MKEYQELKKQRNFLTKRERLFKSNWRHGIVGVEGPDSPKNEIYQKLNQEKSTKNALKVRKSQVRQALLMENS